MVSWALRKEKHVNQSYMYFYKITKIVQALWLAERSVRMRVCKHGSGVKVFCFSRANHTGTNLKKFPSSKQVYFIYQFLRRLKLGKSLQRSQFFAHKLTVKARKIRIVNSIFLQNKNWLCMQDVVFKTLRLVRISLLISAITKSFAFFLGKVIL